MYQSRKALAEQGAIPVRSPDAKPAISVVGLGYVGAVSTACLASLGHRVVGVDIDAGKVAAIASGSSPIHEQELGELLSQGVADELIGATDDLERAVLETDVTFVSVGTPTAEDGGCDTRYIEEAARTIGRALSQKSNFHVVVMRCSVPPGTTLELMAPIIEQVSGKQAGLDFGIAFNPEFLREGVAIADFRAPPKTVIGATDPRSAGILQQIYAPVDMAPIQTSIETAEMVKYTDNVWHAAKVCFANEIGRLCRPMGVDSNAVMEIFVKDTKLNLSPYYLRPGFAYGGSCLPKEVRAVQHLAERQGVNLPMIGNLGQSNDEHIQSALRMVEETGATEVGVLGLAFKPGTDDLRESPILEVIAALHAKGVKVVAHDPAITRDTPIQGQLDYVAHASPGLSKLAKALPEMLCDEVSEVLLRSDTLIVSQNNAEYRAAATWAAGSGEMSVIDLVRLFRELPDSSAYAGIGW